jgi:hypothetical protein
MQNTDLRSFDLTQRTVFGLLAQTLFGAAYTPEPDVDWTAVYLESECQAVRLQTFANHHLIPSIPDPLRADIRRYIMAAMLKDARIHAQHTLLHNLMTGAGIPYSVLKGASSAHYYPNSLTRAMGDVDFYVDPSDVAKASEIFRGEGFDVEDYDADSPAKYHVGIRKGNIHMEMHYKFPGLPSGPMGERILSYLGNIRETAVLTETGTVTCMLPAPLHHGIIMLMHLQHHLLCEGIGLRHLCDWAVFVNAFDDEEFLTILRKPLEDCGLWCFARMLSLTSALYIGLPERSWMRASLAEDEVATALMLDILQGGNFGVKDRRRSFEGMFISDRKNGGRQGRMRQAFALVNQRSREKWPIMRKYPILLPLGWIARLWGFLIHNLQRQKKGSAVSLTAAYRKSGERKELYACLRLYEPET